MTKKLKVRNLVSIPLVIFSLVISTEAATAKRYLRIVSLSPSATEDLFALGAGKLVVAVDDNSNFPKGIPTSKLSSFNPSAEAIVKFKPDLVIIQSTATKSELVIKQLRALKISVYIEKTPKEIKDLYKEILDLGELTNLNSQAKTLVKRIKTARAAALSKTSNKKLKIFHEIDNTLYSATSMTFIGKVYQDFGLTNIADVAAKADDGGYPQLQSEYVIGANPDLIFLADAQYGENLTKVAERPGWSGISAIKNGKVFELPPDIASRWGPRIIDFYELVANAIP